MKKLIVFYFLLFSLACQKAEQAKLETSPTPTVQTKTEPTNNVLADKIEVAKLVKKSVAELDKMFGPPEEIKKVENNGEYRLYKIANQPKGLAVRFYGGQALSFNLILSKPVSTSQEAILKTFGIDVGKTAPGKDPKEPLSEKYQGTFGGVKFTKVSAKKDEKGKGFIFVMAEVKE